MYTAFRFWNQMIQRENPEDGVELVVMVVASERERETDRQRDQERVNRK
jgi:hypothetical protein